MQKIITILIIFLLQGVVIHQFIKIMIQKFKIIVEKMEGMKEINNLIKNQLELYSSKNSTNEYYVTIKTNFQKNII